MSLGRSSFMRNCNDIVDIELESLVRDILFLLKVRLPSGTIVKIQHNYWGNNVYLQAPKADRGKTKGMCGNFNGDPNDDYLGGDKILHNDPDSFGQSWR